MHVAAKVVAALVIVLVGASAPASADPRGWGHGYRGHDHWRPYHPHWRPYRPWDRDRYNYNPLPGFLGGIFGGWLGSQLNKDRDDGRDERNYRDDRPRY